MLVNGKPYRSLWESKDGASVFIIDQRWLPHRFVIEEIRTVEQMATAIREMHVRGAVLIGAAAAYGMVLAARQALSLSPSEFHSALRKAAQQLLQTRPTAINLQWAIEQQLAHLQENSDPATVLAAVLTTARKIVDEDLHRCASIGQYGFAILEQLIKKKSGQPLNILTHCNAGWLGCIDYGTATAPIYHAAEHGLPLHVWVDETRPWNQGARLTAWELAQQGIPHTVIADNAAAHLMQRGMVDIVIIGADRVTRTGDVANKIGSLEKAVCAHYFDVPVYVALPTSSIHWELSDGVADIPIEERSADEVHYVSGWNTSAQELCTVRITPRESPARNWAFDVTPATFITGFITEFGVFAPSELDTLRSKIAPSVETPYDTTQQ